MKIEDVQVGKLYRLDSSKLFLGKVVAAKIVWNFQDMSSSRAPTLLFFTEKELKIPALVLETNVETKRVKVLLDSTIFIFFSELLEEEISV